MLWPLPSFASGNAKTVSLATWLACDAPHLVSGRRVTDSSAGRGGTESPPQPRENSPDFFLSHPNLLMNLLQSLWTCFKERKCADYYFRLFAIRCRRKGFGCVGSARVGAVARLLHTLVNFCVCDSREQYARWLFRTCTEEVWCENEKWPNMSKQAAQKNIVLENRDSEFDNKDNKLNIAQVRVKCFTGLIIGVWICVCVCVSKKLIRISLESRAQCEASLKKKKCH